MFILLILISDDHIEIIQSKEVKYFKKNNRFQEPYNVKYFKEMKRLKSLQKAETYLEGRKHLRWSFFVNILNRLLFLQ